MKIWLRRTHLILTLLSSVLLLSICISGALLSFAKEAEQLFLSERWQVTAKPASLLKSDGLSELVSRLNQQLPTDNPAKLILIESNPNLAWQAILKDGLYTNFNPYNGEVLYSYRFEDSPYGFLMAWHRWLLYSNKDEKPLRPIISCAALVLIVQLLLGLWMWLRPKNRLRRLRVNFSLKFHGILYQLHSVLGVLLILPLILIAFSGMSFYWENATSNIVEGITQQNREQPIHPRASATGEKEIHSQLNAAFQSAHKALPQGELHRIYLPINSTDPLKLRIKIPGQSHPYSWAWADANNGELLGHYNASQANLATQIWNFRYRFHIGDFYGLPVRLIWIAIALAPVFFLMGGLYLFYRRYRRSGQW